MYPDRDESPYRVEIASELVGLHTVNISESLENIDASSKNLRICQRGSSF
eukprot:CCRYP_010518-RA/>CCRYP_010518-RA protein AED:0.00 eAED:0.00 QI:86/1/0.5/1/0/0/2/0/49